MSQTISVGAQVINRTATIANGASLSNVVDMDTARLFAIQMPAAWTAAVLTFSVSFDGVTYADMYDVAGVEVSFTTSAARYLVLTNPVQWQGVRFVKVRSGTSAAAVNQAAERVLNLVLLP